MAPPTSPAAVAAAARASPTPAAALALFKSALSADRALCPLSVLPHLSASPSLPHLLLTASAAARPHATSLRLYAQLKSLSVPIPVASLHPLLSSLPSAPAFALFADIYRLRLPLCTTTFNIMLRHLCATGKPVRALELLRQMPRPNAVTYNTVIAGFCARGRVQAALEGLCKIGQGDDAENLMKEMVAKGITPDDSTYISLIEGLTTEDERMAAADAAKA
ncbi:Pentatricopeptide repeat-containing protein [Zea mays]|uniref:Pentatricopeptide repeat-containing protein n=1 Tax=Zea mays TaxID=4577 RepID=A0A3L6FV04_MAIZE|nr:Pentatricopeptide repeat-containing protein [Zea mays]